MEILLLLSRLYDGSALSWINKGLTQHRSIFSSHSLHISTNATYHRQGTTPLIRDAPDIQTQYAFASTFSLRHTPLQARLGSGVDYLPNNLRPLAGAPIWQTSHTLQTVPLYFEWYFTPSKGHAELGEPPYIGVKDAPQISNSANWSNSASTASEGLRSHTVLIFFAC